MPNMNPSQMLIAVPYLAEAHQYAEDKLYIQAEK